MFVIELEGYRVAMAGAVELHIVPLLFSELGLFLNIVLK
jgi:hypothetical protein